MRSSKRLGQHFLKNKEKIIKIIDALELEDDETVIEIGAGQGELTKELEFRIQNLESRIIAIEKDKNLTKKLQKQFENHKKIEIIEGDILKILTNLPKSYILNPKSLKIVGNIPYYITGQLLRVIGELEPKPRLVVLTLQKEVAERLCAGPPHMNLLAASVQFWAEPEIIDYIPKKDFTPQPKVDSAIIKLTTKSSILNPKSYYRLIKILFKQPRKTILNNLVEADLPGRREAIKKKLQQIGINPNDRPQALSVDKIQKLS